MSQPLGCPEKRPNQRLTLDATGEINSRQPVEKLWRNRIDQSPSPLRTPPFVETQKAGNNEASKPMPLVGRLETSQRWAAAAEQAASERVVVAERKFCPSINQ
ncbi:hypothetical protein T01_5324 [Trichinella spiralis]|uniref:Uncharacterized protein n=1 Tax=Trichinella spiralis TaxID=6334 RepID=A0A0V1BHQ6_TRISP|nr:hypothetical protein T01_5324 [Trichinella spiralis]